MASHLALEFFSIFTFLKKQGERHKVQLLTIKYNINRYAIYTEIYFEDENKNHFFAHQLCLKQ